MTSKDELDLIWCKYWDIHRYSIQDFRKDVNNLIEKERQQTAEEMVKILKEYVGEMENILNATKRQEKER